MHSKILISVALFSTIAFTQTNDFNINVPEVLLQYHVKADR